MIAEMDGAGSYPAPGVTVKRGRDHMIAEMRTEGRVQIVQRTASMRPRSYDRGNMQQTLHRSVKTLASMRPRSYDRGNDTLPPGNLRRIAGFNEAAII